MPKKINDITKTIESSILSFQKKIPGLQDKAFDELQALLKELETKGGKVIPNLNNLKAIRRISNKLGSIIVDKEYLAAVKDFVKAFDQVQGWHNQYFAELSAKFKPSQTLDIIKQSSIDATLNSLLDSGITANVIDKVGDILRQNITAGGSYASLSNQLRDHIKTNDTGEGSLERYSKQITTDAINQFSGQYHATIASDLGLNWGRYVGSNLTTTREFCELLTAKEWVHKSELPEILKGRIDGKQCQLGKKTGLPLGMIPNTTASNFQVLRGGYNCQHQFYYVADSVVPDEIKKRVSS